MPAAFDSRSRLAAENRSIDPQPNGAARRNAQATAEIGGYLI
jgi:hypothetical protein